MKSMLCLLVAICAFQTIAAFDPLASLRQQLQRSKSNVQSTINDLERIKRDEGFRTNIKISGKTSEFMGNINGFVNPALSDIRANVDKAKTEGKNAEPCYDNAKETLRTASKDAFSDINRCKTNAESTLESALSPVDELIAVGNRLLRELDGVFLGCMSGNVMQTSTCVAVKLGTINMSVREFENNANSIKYKVSSNANNALLQMQSCGFDVVSATRAKTTDARIASNNCIKNA